MKTWRQTRLFECPDCGQRYRHDEAHGHHCYRCPARPRVTKVTSPAEQEEQQDDRRATGLLRSRYAGLDEPTFADVCSRRIPG